MSLYSNARRWLPYALGGVTLILATAAAWPLFRGLKHGGYASMAGYAFAFGPDPAQAGTGGNGVAPVVDEAIRARFTPAEAEALLAKIRAERFSSRMAGAAEAAQRERRAARRARAAARPKPAAPPPAPEAKPAPAPPAPRRLDEDAVRERFEADLSKFPLDATIWAGGLSLRLIAVAKWEGAYAVKLAVDNRTAADFFVKEVSAAAPDAKLAGRRMFPLLVEKGRVRDGYLLFEAPARGAKVQILVKEDGGEGRVLRAPLRYPF